MVATLLILAMMVGMRVLQLWREPPVTWPVPSSTSPSSRTIGRPLFFCSVFSPWEGLIRGAMIDDRGQVWSVDLERHDLLALPKPKTTQLPDGAKALDGAALRRFFEGSRYERQIDDAALRERAKLISAVKLGAIEKLEGDTDSASFGVCHAYLWDIERDSSQQFALDRWGRQREKNHSPAQKRSWPG